MDIKIKELMKKGYLIQDKSLISSLREEEFNKLLSKLPKLDRPKILTEEEINRFLEKKDIRIKVIIPERREKITTSDIIEILKNRYNFLASIIKTKISFFNNLISINKISKIYRTFSIIGMVYKIAETKLTLEDFSSKIEVIINKNKIENFSLIEEDCVIGLRCYWEENNIISNEIVFPEFNLERVKELDKNLEIGINLDRERKKEGDITIFFEKNKSRVVENIIYLNDLFPLHQFYINDNLVILIDEERVSFNFEKLVKLRLVESSIKRILFFGEDIFLIKDVPSIIILINSRVNESNIENKDNVLLVRVTPKIKNFVINLERGELIT